MAVTIVSARIKVAGVDVVPPGNAACEVVKLSGTIAILDTGTYTPTRRPILDAGGLPLIVGLPHGIQAAIANGIITFTASAAFTALNVYVLICCEK